VTPKKRNRLGSQKASDLVFVNANLHMLHKYKTGELASRANKFYSLEIRNEDSSDEEDEAPDIPEDLEEEENEESEEEDSIVPQRIRMEADEEDD